MSASDRPDVWSVVKVPYPYTDRPVRQSRPVLVVARTAEAAGTPLLWVLMITSAANRGWAGDVPISDLAAAGFLVIPAHVDEQAQILISVRGEHGAPSR